MTDCRGALRARLVNAAIVGVSFLALASACPGSALADCDTGVDADCDGVPDGVDNCPALFNPGQEDMDRDSQGDACDLDDGTILDNFIDRLRFLWQPEVGFDSFNIYRGDLRALREQRLYTQDPSNNPLATQTCHLVGGGVLDNAEPAPGEAAFFLVTGNRGLEEGTLGSDSAGSERPNNFPCPPDWLRGSMQVGTPIAIDGNAAFTADNGVTSGSGTISDPYVIEGWWVSLSNLTPRTAFLIRGTDAFVVIRNVIVSNSTGGTSIALDSVRNVSVESVRMSGTEGSTCVRISSSQDVAVRNSRCSAIIGHGITVLTSARVEISGNTIYTSRYPNISLRDSSFCTVFGNRRFTRASVEDINGNGNLWDAGYAGGGNYWIDYAGPDTCHGPAQDVCDSGDGLGDVPMGFYLDSRDRYPLMILPGTADDLLPPLVSISSVGPGYTTPSLEMFVSCAASDPGHGLRRVEHRVNNGSWSGIGCPFEIPPQPGLNLIEARAWDDAGNVSLPASFSVMHDGAALESRITTDKQEYAPGEPVGVDLAITNVGSADVTLHFSSYNICRFSFTVEDATGSRLFTENCGPIPANFILIPGQTYHVTYVWQQLNDLAVPVRAPATYTLRGRFLSQELAPEATTLISIH